MKTWIKRTAALVVTAAAAVALTGPTAEAGQTAAINFTVSAQVFASCTAAMPSTAITFPNYTVAQAGADTALIDVDITCPGSTALLPDPVTIGLTPAVANGSVGFQLSSAGAAGKYLNYQMCDNTLGCAGAGIYPASGAAGTSISVGSGALATNYSLLGSIAGGQSPTAGFTYAQTIALVVNY